MKMRGLFLKVFAIFWLAQSLIFVISTALIVRQRFPSPSTLANALDSHLQHDADAAIRAFHSAGCAGFAKDVNRHEPAGALLLKADGDVVCRSSASLSLPGLVPPFPGRVDGRQVNGRYLWLVPVVDSDGNRYEYIWLQPPGVRQERRPSLLHYAFPQLPVAITVGGLTTFALILLFSRPLVRLRQAARELAQGNLAARVDVSPTEVVQSHSNEFQGLVHDFNHMAERLESLVGAQRLLLRDVSHELRSPLSRLSVALELAREDAGPVAEKHLSRIEREGEKLNQLIGELLVLSSMESMDMTSTFGPVSLNRLCEQMLPDAEYEAQRRPCTVVLEERAECIVQGDWSLLYRALENVVRNAIRYTEPGTEVTIRLQTLTADAGDFTILDVLDRGPGIPGSEVENIFRPFYRLDSARSAATGGFGVGLAITERAVRLHGGTVSARNRDGNGTCMRITFPRK